MEIISALDVMGSCRACLQPAECMESLFETSFENVVLSDLLIEVNPNLPKILKEDKLSHLICLECQAKLISAYQFQQLCSLNDAKVRQLMQQSKVDASSTFKIEDQSRLELQNELALIDPYKTLDDALQNDENDVMLPELKPLEDEFESETQENSNDDDSFEDSEESSDPESENKKLSCETCDASFNSFSKLERHIKQDHQARKSKSAISEDNESSGDDELSNLFTCDLCPKTFKKPSLLARHVKTHDPNKRPHECQKCNKRFPSQVALVRHSVIHSELVERSKINRPESQDFSCVVCERTFKSSESLSTHLKSHKLKSNEKQEYDCKLCHDVFPTFTDIIRHSKNHIENATHQCTICSKLFVVGDELIDHFLRHKGLKPHQCPVCEKSFLKLHKLNVHMRIHSDDKVTLTVQ
jgi:Zinc-finger associated domain (zf-AD)/Zinc-finger double-stranded RNA-binding/Zinc finger, C2H2 type/C2H2-type zinc finger